MLISYWFYDVSFQLPLRGSWDTCFHQGVSRMPIGFLGPLCKGLTNTSLKRLMCTGKNSPAAPGAGLWDRSRDPFVSEYCTPPCPVQTTEQHVGIGNTVLPSNPGKVCACPMCASCPTSSPSSHHQFNHFLFLLLGATLNKPGGMDKSAESPGFPTKQMVCFPFPNKPDFHVFPCIPFPNKTNGLFMLGPLFEVL